MKHALALLLLSCALVAQDKPASPVPQDETSATKLLKDQGLAVAKSFKHRHLMEQFVLLTELIKQNETAAKNAFIGRGIKGIDSETIKFFDKAYMDFSMLALEQRKLWTQTLSEMTELMKTQ
jgi:hypothetical protein